MATPKIVADFETQLATALSVGDTSFTLASATDDDGVALPTGKYYFTIDNGTSQKEYVVGTVTGASVTAVSNVTRQGTESSGVDRAHRVGSSVIISDFLTYKNYIDETTTAGASDADTNTKGVVEGATLAEVRARTATGSTGAALVITPDVADDMPTEDEKAAMVGGGDYGTPGSANKFVTGQFLKGAGDGSDGALNITTNTTISSGGTTYGIYVVFQYTTMNIDTGVTLTFSSAYQNKIIVLLCQGDATLNGSINLKGLGGLGGALNTDGTPGVKNFNNSNGKSITDSNAGTLMVGGFPVTGADDIYIGCGSGGGGGRTFSFAGGTGGNGGGAIIISVAGILDMGGLTIDVSGNNGNNAANDNSGSSFLTGVPGRGGGGGGGGSALILASDFTDITTTYTFTVAGGAGGSGSSAPGASGGSPGSTANPGTSSGGSSVKNAGVDGLVGLAPSAPAQEGRNSSAGGDGIGVVKVVRGSSEIIKLIS